MYPSHETERGEAVGGAAAGGSARVQNPKGSVTSDHVLLRTVRAVRPVPAGRMARAGFVLGVWNVRTLRGEGKLEVVVGDLARAGVDVCGICETRWSEG